MNDYITNPAQKEIVDKYKISSALLPQTFSVEFIKNVLSTLKGQAIHSWGSNGKERA